MSRSNKIFVLLLVCTSLTFMRPAFAENAFATCWTQETAHYDMWRKAGRGLSNLAFGWLEIFYQPFYMVDQGNRLPIAVGGGLLRGTYKTILRMGTGLYEFISFPVPVPKGYKPILYPELSPPSYCPQVKMKNAPVPYGA